uniref:Disease resistance R13L4/SHOC-2-like LRR domain-containing protein n=1 Tax=Aplanochytrium stocchinoi TaxID=215587 RepID=A0A7S3PNR3_9STRA
MLVPETMDEVSTKDMIVNGFNQLGLNQENPSEIYLLPAALIYRISEFLQDDRWLILCHLKNIGPKRLILKGQQFLESKYENVLSRLPTLEVLEISYPHGRGEIDYVAFKNLVNLKVLRVQLNRYTHIGLSSISSLQELRELDLSYNSLKDGLCEQLSQLSHLKVLRARQTQLTSKGVHNLSSMVQLVELDLGNNSIKNEGCEHISKLINLMVLNIQGTNTNHDGVLYVASSLEKLEKLNLNGNGNPKHDGNVSCLHLSKLKSLKEIRFEGAGVTAVGLENLATSRSVEHMKLLHLNKNAIGDIGCISIAKFVNLKGIVHCPILLMMSQIYVKQFN